MKLCGDVTDGGDFVLVWTTSVQDTLRRIIQFLDCVESHALNKCTFNLRQKKKKKKKKKIRISTYEKIQSTVAFQLHAVCLNFKNTVQERVFSMSWKISMEFT